MYFRLVVPQRHADSGRRAGVFAVAYRLLREADLRAHEARALRRALAWFERHLTAPRLREPRAIFWFHAGAGESARRVWELANAVKAVGVPVEIAKT